ncbi:MAG: hypothetical protein HZA78_04445 [Candidatus Schekmanbacteria bacterium]|nr:hypothetical protein [Candidatus Schekmanbacteria bacterium]
MQISQIYKELELCDFSDFSLDINYDSLLNDTYNILDLKVKFKSNSKSILNFLNHSFGYFYSESTCAEKDFVIYENGPFFSSLLIYTPWLISLIYNTNNGFIGVYQKNGNPEKHLTYIGTNPEKNLPLNELEITKINILNDDMLFIVDFLLTIIIANLNKNYFLFHAAALGLNGKGIVIAGDTMAGKTTLTLALANAGFDLLSDEVCCLEYNSFNLIPFPKCMFLREKTKKLLPDLFDRYKDNPIFNDSKENRWLVTSEDLGIKATKNRYKTSHFFLLKGFKDEPEYTPVAEHEVLLYLLSSSYAKIENPPNALYSLSPLVNNVKCYNLWPGKVENTVDLIKEFIKQ